jgi:putative flippase GtrA
MQVAGSYSCAQAWVWIKEHRLLLFRYAAVGTVAWVINLCCQTVFVETVGANKSVAYSFGFIVALVVYYYLLRKYVWPGKQYRWQEIFHQIGAIKLFQALAGLGLYQLLLAMGLKYFLALVCATMALTVPFFVLTKWVLKRPEVEEVKA